jgi:Flp pilus assembly protein TadG
MICTPSRTSCERIGWWRRRLAPGHGRTGIAAMEFAVVAPLLAIIMLGMFELSRAMMVLVILNDAARKGCRVGALAGGQYNFASDPLGNTPDPATDPYSVVVQVNNILKDNNIAIIDPNDSSTGQINVYVATYDPSTNTYGPDTLTNPSTGQPLLSAKPMDKVSVTVSLPYSKVFWVSTFFVPRQELESQTMVMMRQGG